MLDPVDGSTNCAREHPVLVHLALRARRRRSAVRARRSTASPGARFTAIRGGGAWLDDAPASRVAPPRELGRSVVAISGLPDRACAWRQFRALGSAALALCDVAAGHVDGYLDAHADQHAPWDYLGGLLVCREAGALVVDAQRPTSSRSPTRRCAASWSRPARPSCSTALPGGRA